MTTPVPSHPPGEAPDTLPAALPGSPHAIRRIGPPEAPFPGTLARTERGAVLLVDAALLEDWDGWDAGADGHVAGPLDLVRRHDGHDVALPACTERLDDFLARRAGRAPLSDGETVTAAVSVLRGCAEAGGRHPDVRGVWWLTDAGRPVFVADCGASTGEGVRDASAGAIARLTECGGLPQAVADRAHAALRHPRALEYALSALEEEIFAMAEPAPLATTNLAPVRAREVTRPVAAQVPSVRATTWATFAAHVDAGLVEAASAAATDVWRWFRRRRERTGRRGPARRAVVIGGAVGTLVLAVGLLWPTDATGPVSAGAAASVSPRAPDPSPAASRSPTLAESAGASPDAPPPGLADTAAALLDARLACAGSRACLAASSEDPGARFPAGVVDLPRERRREVLLDEFGGAAVLRVEATAGGSAPQLVVIVQRGGEWLIRDVTDVADQP